LNKIKKSLFPVQRTAVETDRLLSMCSGSMMYSNVCIPILFQCVILTYYSIGITDTYTEAAV